MRKRIELGPVATSETLELQRALGVSSVMAQVLARRGLGDPAAAAEFLERRVCHELGEFAGLDQAVTLLRRHVERGSRITIHGDYDVDGVAATAILVGALRELGADVDWFIPGRAEDGYGLSAATVERLAKRGTALIVTADCGITAVQEVALATRLGVDVIVTDHHSPPADGTLPAAPIVHPGVGRYPWRELCGAAVAHKLVAALLGPERAERDLDLVALATIADCVPLLDENRTLVDQGLRALATTPRPGLRALIEVAGVDPSRIDSGAVSFRLAPRINAAGRIHRADVGVELLLTDDPARGREIAAQLDERNSQRRHEEQQMRFAAEAVVAEIDPDGAKRALVVAGEGWHRGVIGIVASRLVERHGRPVVVVALDGATGTASGRSIPGFDLLAALQACGEHLLRFGGHRAAAGATIERSELDAFRAKFEAHAASVLTDEDLVPTQRADAVVSGGELGAELAEELARLGPFGVANPPVSLLVPCARLVDPATMGEGRHLRFSVWSGGVRARAVAFGTTSLPDAEHVDAVFELELNEYRGAVEPRLLLRAAQPSAPPPIEILGEPAPGTDAWRALALAAPGATAEAEASRAPAWDPMGPLAVTAIDRRGLGLAGTLTAAVRSGEPTLVLCADVELRARHFRDRLGGFSLAAWGAVEADARILHGHRHVVALDPPPDRALLERVASAAERGSDGAFLHLGWGRDELRFTCELQAGRDAPRALLATLYRELRQGGLAAVSLPAWRVRQLLPVLVELGLATADGSLLEATGRTDLERSARYRELQARHLEALAWLTSATTRAA